MTREDARGEMGRLDELAAVTRAYAQYSRSSFGTALVYAGAWLAVAGAVIAASSQIGVHLLRATPLVWLVALRQRRAYYQRRGEVVEQEPVGFPFLSAGEARVAGLALTCLWCILGIVGVGGAGGAGPLALGAAIFVAVAALAVGTVKGAADGFATSPFAMFGMATFLVSWGPVVRGAAHAGFGLAFAGAGLWQHLRYRALERRLAALRSPTP